MFKKDNIIQFLYPKGTKDLFKDVFPIPAKLNIPEWYKDLKTSQEYVTIKSCIPFLDALTAGYILRMPQDFHVKHNYVNKEGNRDSNFRFGFSDAEYGRLIERGINMNTKDRETHHPDQLGRECPFHKKNKYLPYYKILNPFKIVTPPGYSCLFVPPLNNTDDRFNIISGLVDTDTFKPPVNFPIIINGDKYPELESTIKKGTPYVQVIPFKRESWKMKMGEQKDDNIITHLTIMKEVWNNYKNNLWSKKRWM
tara:strand:+ start:900 stop:1658 length:759 start_codon:yes stop_codon:yes gene_type:complete